MWKKNKGILTRISGKWFFSRREENVIGEGNRWSLQSTFFKILACLTHLGGYSGFSAAVLMRDNLGCQSTRIALPLRQLWHVCLLSFSLYKSFIYFDKSDLAEGILLALLFPTSTYAPPQYLTLCLSEFSLWSASPSLPGTLVPSGVWPVEVIHKRSECRRKEDLG